MSIIGLWASSTVLVIYNTLYEQLPACTLPGQWTGGLEINCGKVLSSPYSSVFGVPLEVFGVGYFIVNLALIYLIGFGTERIYGTAFKTLFAWRFIGLALVPYLVTVEFFVVKAICLYCTIMHISIIVDFAVISYFLFYRRNLRGFPNTMRTPPHSHLRVIE